MRRAVFLDRDGVINKSIVRNERPFAPTNMDEFEFYPDVKGALNNLRQEGYLNIVITNQPDIKAGKLSSKILLQMHEEMLMELPIDHIEVCIHTDEDACNCRKPRPGMLLNAAGKLNIDLKTSWMIGDRWRDITAGQAVGCSCYFIDHGYNERRPDQPFIITPSLSAAVSEILQNSANK